MQFISNIIIGILHTVINRFLLYYIKFVLYLFEFLHVDN
jgi:hypothetical protein